MALTTDLVAYWKFDGDATDSVGSNDGTVDGASNSASYGVINQGYRFDGNNDEIRVDDSTDVQLAGDEYSISFWLYAASAGAGTTRRMINKDDGNDTSGGYSIMLTNGNAFRWYHNTGTTPAQAWTPSWAPSTNTWYHIVLVYENGVQRKLYVDGSEEESSSLHDDNIAAEADDKLHFGSIAVYGQYFEGDLDEIGFWNRALTPSEVSELYNGGSGLQYPFTASPPTYNSMFFGGGV